ncbi:MAG: alpha/beta fold hydrolase [Bacteroidota bacterium]
MKLHWLAILLSLLLTACLERNIPADPPSGMLKVFDTSLYYKKIGRGKPIVVLHGGPGMSHDYFLPHMEELAQNFQLIFYDQRYAGHSSLEGDSMGLRMDQLVEDLEFLREQFGIEKLNLMGHSWGGLLAMWYAKTYPENLNSLMFVNSIAPNRNFEGLADSVVSRRRDEKDDDLLRDWYRSDEYKAGEPDAYYYIQRLSYKYGFYYPQYLDSMRIYVPMNYNVRQRRLYPLYRDLRDYNLVEDLSGLEIPSLFIHGDFDPTPKAAVQQLVDVMPDAELAILPYCGHFSFIEAPEQFNRLVRQFMKDK